MARYNIQGMNKVRGHLGNLQDDLVVKDSTSTKAGRGVHSILMKGRDAWRNEYLIAGSKGVENLEHVNWRINIGAGGFENWGRLEAEGKKLFFAEFGTGINLNKGSSRGIELGYTPASWSLGEGKGYLGGNRLVLFQGWWPVKKGVPRAVLRQFVTAKGTIITRRVVQGNDAVNGVGIAVELMHKEAAQTMKHFFEIK